MFRVSATTVQRARRLLSGLDWSPRSTHQLARLAALFCEVCSPPDPLGMFTEFAERQRLLREALDAGPAELFEQRVLEAYVHLHGYQGRYTPEERQRFEAAGGYWSHAGGVSPLVRAAPYLGPRSVSMDLGAGNGLQGLLLQWLYPHRLAIQVEISGALIECGQALQRWLGIATGRVRWVHADLLDYQPQPCDFVYLYRPVRPQGPGGDFYRRLAASLASQPPIPVIFSIADCLAGFLPEGFEVFYSDGQLTCFRREPHDRPAMRA